MGARILNIDIEMSPSRSYHWGLFDQTIGIAQVEEQGHMMCFAAKWYGEDKIIFKSEFHDGQEVMLAEAWNLLDEADALMGWNSEAFDYKHLKREFIEMGYAPPTPCQHIDLLKVARKEFRFLSNKLDFIAKQLDIGSKVQHHGFKLWRDCMAGDKKAWALFKRYNKQDVKLVEEAYEILKPWINTSTLNLAHFCTDGFGCPRCGSPELSILPQSRYTKVSKYDQYRCEACGFIARDRLADKTHTKPELV